MLPPWLSHRLSQSFRIYLSRMKILHLWISKWKHPTCLYISQLSPWIQVHQSLSRLSCEDEKTPPWDRTPSTIIGISPFADHQHKYIYIFLHWPLIFLNKRFKECFLCGSSHLSQICVLKVIKTRCKQLVSLRFLERYNIQLSLAISPHPVYTILFCEQFSYLFTY